MACTVSIIMPVYNAEKYLALAINSVIDQSYKDWELIIVDDGSTDSSAEIIHKFLQEDIRIVYLFQKNKKQAAARNTGIKHSKGQFVAFLDADDLWAPEKLQAQVEAIQNNEVDLCFSGGVIVDEVGRFQNTYPTIFGEFSGEEIYKRMYEFNPIPIMSVLVKKYVIDTVGFQDESSQIVGCEDFDYWLRISVINATFLGLDKNLFSYRTNPEGTSRGILQMKIAECNALYKNLDINKFAADDLKKLQWRFLELIKFIIPNLFFLFRYDEISHYFKLLYSITGLFKYRLAALHSQLSPFRSARLLNYFLN